MKNNVKLFRKTFTDKLSLALCTIRLKCSAQSSTRYSREEISLNGGRQGATQTFDLLWLVGK